MTTHKSDVTMSGAQMSAVAIELRRLLELRSGSEDDTDQILARLLAGRVSTSNDPQELRRIFALAEYYLAMIKEESRAKRCAHRDEVS